MMKSILQRIKSAVALDSRSHQKRGEQDALYYDELYDSSGRYAEPYIKSRDYFMWTVIVDRVKHARPNGVLEVGCGSGQLAAFLKDEGIEKYVGMDFSDVAISHARQRVPEYSFLVADARDRAVFSRFDYEIAICTEVLEHIEADLEVVSNFPVGVRCICSVPNFPYRSHVRHFLSADAVVDRYSPYFNNFDVSVFRRPDSDGGIYYLFDGVKQAPLPEGNIAQPHNHDGAASIPNKGA